MIDVGGRLHSAATGNVLAGANEILDDAKGKRQSDINAEQSEVTTRVEGEQLDQRNRIEALEHLAEISVEGGTMQIANDIDDIEEGSAKIPTANAVSGLGRTMKSAKWIYAITDSKGHILAGIKANGEWEWAKGTPQPLKDYVSAQVTPIATRIDGMEADVQAQIDGLREEIKEDGSEYVASDSWIYAIIDIMGHIVAGIRADGTCFANGISGGGGSGTDDVHEWIADQKGRIEITVDSVSQILSYRKADGTKVEIYFDARHLNIGRLTMDDDAVNDLVKILRDSGFSASSATDWSKSKDVVLPMPKQGAMVNLIVPKELYETAQYKADKQGSYRNYIDEDGHIKHGLAYKKGLDWECEMEYWDKLGNYFRKPVIVNAQGDTSMLFEINNQAFDLDDGSVIKIGNWPEQDSFHLKKYFQDAFRGQCVVGYRLAEEVYQTRGAGHVRPWDYLIAQSGWQDGSGKMKEDFDTGAQGHPDGFPVEMFCNGKSVGVYAFNLKKHRDVYYMGKTKHNNILLDGVLGPEFWGANGDLTVQGGNHDHVWDDFEIRNPKSLVYAQPQNGSYKYDADVKETEIAGLNGIGGSYPAWTGSQAWPQGAVVALDGHQYIATKAHAAGDQAPALNIYAVIIDTLTAEVRAQIETLSYYSELKETFISGKTAFLTDNKAHANEIKAIAGGDVYANIETYANTDSDPDYKDKGQRGWLNCSLSCKVKAHINRLTTAMTAIAAATGTEAQRATAETFFNIPFLIDYELIGEVIYHTDGFRKNWIWGTWDGGLWAPTLYDLDSIFGTTPAGTTVMADRMSHIIGKDAWMPTSLLTKNKIYWQDTVDRYTYLRQIGTFTVDNIVQHLTDWLDSVGYTRLDRDLTELFPDTPAYRDPLVNDEYWELVREAGDTEYSEASGYEAGAEVWYKDRYMHYVAKKAVPAGETPCTLRTAYPYEGGIHNGIQRVRNWLTARIAVLDEYYGYSEE